MCVAAFPSAFSRDDSNTVLAQKPWPNGFSPLLTSSICGQCANSHFANPMARLHDIASLQ